MSASQTRKRSSHLEGAQNAVTDSVKRQVSEVAGIANDAVVSGAWAYPLLGVYYLLTHPQLAKPLIPLMVKGALMSLGIVAGFFFFAYLPQVAMLALVSGPLAFIAAVPLVLGEAYVAVNFLTRAFLLGQAGTNLFDSVLVQQGHSALVQQGRQVHSSSGAAAQLGSLFTKPLNRFSLDSLVRYVLSLPLNLIPVVGTVFFLAYNGFKAGPGYHARYFQLKGYDQARRYSAVHKNRGSYTAFGMVAMLLNLIPIASIFFSFTSIIGAALWAANIEAKSGAGSKINGGAIDVTLSSDAKKDL